MTVFIMVWNMHLSSAEGMEGIVEMFAASGMRIYLEMGSVMKAIILIGIHLTEMIVYLP